MFRFSGAVCATAVAIGGTTPQALADAESGGGFEHYQQAVYDLTGVEYGAGLAVIEDAFEIGAGVQAMRLKWESVILETFDHTGAPNWASEAWFGIEGVDQDGAPLQQIVQPFPDDFDGGVFGPVDGSLDIEFAHLFADPDGMLGLLVGSTWDDGSGLPAGQYLNGTLIVEFIGIPAPATLAVLALAARGRRRRR